MASESAIDEADTIAETPDDVLSVLHLWPPGDRAALADHSVLLINAANSSAVKMRPCDPSHS